MKLVLTLYLRNTKVQVEMYSLTTLMTLTELLPTRPNSVVAQVNWVNESQKRQLSLGQDYFKTFVEC